MPKIRSDHDIYLIQEATKDIPFFKKYIQEDLHDVHKTSCKYITYEKFEQSEVVFSQGEKGSKFYIILEGKIGIFIKNKSEIKKVKELQNGESFGELALINDAPRSATIKCITDCHFAVLDKKNYITLFQQILDNEIKKEISFYPEIELFSSWNFNKIKSFYNHSFRIKVRKGDKIIQESDPVDAIYIIVSGEFVLRKKNESEKFNKKGDLLQLKRQISTMQAQSGVSTKNNIQNQLFIMSSYEIFGQENAEEEDPKFCYSVECQSYEDYMKIIMKDDSQKDYMQNYSKKRMQRVEDRMKEISQTLTLQEKKKDEENELAIPIDLTRTISSALSITSMAQQLEQLETEQQIQERLKIPEQRRTMKKRRTNIDVLGDQNAISNSIDTQSGTYQLTENDETTQFTPQISSFAMKIPSLSNQSSFPGNNMQMQRSSSELPFGKGGYNQSSQAQFKLSFDQTNPQGKIRNKQNKPLSLNNSNLGNSNLSNNNNKQDEPNTPFSLNTSNVSYTPVAARKNHSLNPLKKVSTLSSFFDYNQSPIKTKDKKIELKMTDNSTINMIEDEDINQNSHLNQDTISNKFQIKIPKKSQSPNKQSKHYPQSSISLRFQNELSEEDLEFNNHNKESIEKYAQVQQNNGNTMSTLSQIKSAQRDEFQNKKQIKKFSSMFELPELEYEQLDPLVKGFHEQLKVRFYRKFKDGQIGDLKNHMTYSPIQTLQSNKSNTEQSKIQIRPAIFSNKKKQESKTKEIRDYEHKLKTIIRSQNDIEFESLSPFKIKNDKLLNMQLEQLSPLQSPHMTQRDQNRIQKKNIINLFQTNNNLNQNQQQSQMGPLQNSSNGDSLQVKMSYQILSKHNRIGSIDSAQGKQKLLYTHQDMTSNEDRKTLSNNSSLPNINAPQTGNNPPFFTKKLDINNSMANQIIMQTSLMSTKNVQPISNTNNNKEAQQMENNKNISTSVKPSNNSLLDFKNSQLLVSNRVGFKGQKGFNCSQFNIRKDKVSQQNS